METSPVHGMVAPLSLPPSSVTICTSINLAWVSHRFEANNISKGRDSLGGQPFIPLVFRIVYHCI